MRNSSVLSLIIVAVLIGGIGNVLTLVQASEDGGPAGLGFVSASNGLPTLESHHAVWFGDINNDTNPDIATAGYSGVRVWTGDGAGNWNIAANGLPSNAFDGGVCLGDINNDGNLDIAAANYDYGSYGVSVWTGDGAGSWTLADTGLPTEMWYTGIFLADINHDDNLDLAVANDGGGVKVFTGNGAGVWTDASTNLPTSGKYFGVWMGDVNKDNNTDLAVAGAGVHIWLGDGAGTWTEASNGLPWTDQWNGIALGDINLDGNLDIAASMDMSGHGLRAWLGDGTSNWTLASSGLPASGLYYGVILADLVGDKYPDILAAHFGGEGIKIWKGDGGLSWTDASSTLPTGDAIGVAAGDIDSDGHIDIAAVGQGFGVQVWRNDETAPPLTVEVEEPNGGEVWNAFTQNYINWTASGGTPPLTMQIEYSLGGLFGSYTQISGGEANDGTYLWTVPNTPSTNCFVRVNVTDSGGRTNWDKSNSSFTIVGSETNPPTIVNLQPVNQSITNNTIPQIGASYSDASGIDTSSVILRVDGSNVTSSATVTASDVTYVPTVPLSEGDHDIYLEVRDDSPGRNKATESWSFTVDTLPPTITNPQPYKTIISDVTPEIRASYGDPSGIDTSSVILRLDFVDVTASATIIAMNVTYTPPPLLEGAHFVDLEVKDLSNPQNTATESWWFVVDTLPPTIANLQPANQSIIGVNTPAIGASYSDDSNVISSSVELKVDGIDVTASATVAPFDVTYVPGVPLSDGPHNVYLEAGDNSTPQNVAVETWSFAVDTQPPSISNMYPVNQSTISDTTPAIGADYSDSSGIDMSTVLLRVDSVDVTASATVEFDRVTYVPLSPLLDGVHDVYLEVADNSTPAKTAIETWWFTIDTSIIDMDPPTISNLQPANQSIIGDTTPAIGADYSDPSGIDTASVMLEVDGIDVTAWAAVTPIDVSYTPTTPLSEGAHNVRLEVADGSSNQNTAVWTWWFVVDTTPPTITNLGPPDQSTIGDAIPATGASYIDDSGIDIASVILEVDSVDVSAFAIVTANQITYTPPGPLSEGTHDVYLEVKDQATPQNSATMTWWFVVDTLPPTISNSQPAHQSTVGVTMPTIGASFSDPSGIDVVTLILIVDSIVVTSIAMVELDNIVYTPTLPLSDGVHNVMLVVKDNSAPQNVATENWWFTVDTTIFDLTPPAIANPQPADQSTISDSTPAVGAKYSDDSGIDTTSVVLKVDSVDVSSLATITASDIVYAPAGPLSEGTHTVHLEVEDASANRNRAAETWQFMVDTSPPTVTDLQPANHSTLGDTAPVITASFSDISGIDTASVTLKVDSTDVTASATVVAGQITYVPTTPLADGIHDIYLEVRDQSTPQNTATRTWRFTVDTLPPAITNLQPTNGSTLPFIPFSISASYSDASGVNTTSVTMKLNSIDATGSAEVTADGVTLEFMTRLEAGTYTVYLSVKDIASPPNRAVVVWSFTIPGEPEDSDGDGLPDDWEEGNFGDLGQGADDDPDEDGLTNSQEYALDADPLNEDTDGDGIRDGDDANPRIADETGGDLFAEPWFWVALVAVMVLVALLLFFLFQRRKEEEPAQESDAPRSQPSEE